MYCVLRTHRKVRDKLYDLMQFRKLHFYSSTVSDLRKNIKNTYKNLKYLHVCQQLCLSHAMTIQA